LYTANSCLFFILFEYFCARFIFLLRKCCSRCVLQSVDYFDASFPERFKAVMYEYWSPAMDWTRTRVLIFQYSDSDSDPRDADSDSVDSTDSKLSKSFALFSRHDSTLSGHKSARANLMTYSLGVSVIGVTVFSISLHSRVFKLSNC